jgi:hypothetical protein
VHVTLELFVKSRSWTVLPAVPWRAPAFSARSLLGHGTVPAAAGDVAGSGVVGPRAGEPAGVAEAAADGAPDGLDEAEQAVTSIAPQAATSTPRQTNVALAVKCRGAREDEVIGVLLPGKPAVT